MAERPIVEVARSMIVVKPAGAGSSASLRPFRVTTIIDRAKVLLHRSGRAVPA